MDTPAGGRHVIWLSEVLVEILSNAGTAAVIGHEVGDEFRSKRDEFAAVNTTAAAPAHAQ